MAGDDIRRVDWRLYARTDRYYVKQYEADTNSNFAVLLDVSKSMGFASDGRVEARVRDRSSPRASRISRIGSATASASSPSTTTSSRTCRRRRSTSTCCCTRSIARRPEQPGRLLQSARQDGRALQAPQHRRADLGSLRESGRSARGAQAVSASRQRPRRVPRARSGGDRASRTRTRRAFRISRAARRCRSCPRSSRSSTAR